MDTPEKVKRARAENIENAVQTVIDVINDTRFEPKEFIDQMARQHRTLQQSFTGVCLQWICHLASLNENQYDLRNEASVKIARDIAEKFPDIKYTLPFI